MFKRKIYDRIKEWKEEAGGRTALLIRGARRVGKSTVVEEFAKNEYDSYILIDFAAAPQEAIELFDDISDLDFLFLRLQAIFGVDLVERHSVIVFDEVQKCPKARQAIKYLVKDGRYDYIETGSLLSIRRNVKNIVIPSEETRIDMYPMDFDEFLWACGKEVKAKTLKQFWDYQKPLGDAVHRSMMKEFRLYMLIGGMPQAVEAYLDTNNFRSVDFVKRSILDLYEEDFNTIDARASMLFRALPSQLSSNAFRFQVTTPLPDERYSQTTELVSEMQDSRVILLSHHSNDPSVGLALVEDINYYKMFLLDTGLLTTMIYRDSSSTDDNLYVKLLSNKQHTNLGYVYENVVAQMLKAKGDSLYYYTFPSETSNHKYEIDFLIARNNKICPIEVKSSNYKRHTSLDKFTDKFSDRIAHRYIVYTKDLHKEQDILCLPVYMVPYL